MTESRSGLQWIAKQAIMENELAYKDIESLKIEMLQLLCSHAGTGATFSRKPRAAAAAALATAVLARGIGAGDKLLWFIKSVFGGCDKRIKRNQENIRQAMAYLQYLTTEHVEQISTKENEKFFVVSGELKAIKEAQDEIIKTQNRNWEKPEGQFTALRRNVPHMKTVYSTFTSGKKSTNIVFF